MPRVELSQVRFLGRHRCPRCRMPLRAEELECPSCSLTIVFYDRSGDLMVQMVALNDPEDRSDRVVREYWHTLETEARGDMYMPEFLPVSPQRADVIPLPGGFFAVRYSNMVGLDDITTRSE